MLPSDILNETRMPQDLREIKDAVEVERREREQSTVPWP